MTEIDMVLKCFMKSLSILPVKKYIFEINTYCYMLVLEEKSLIRVSGLPEPQHFLFVGLILILLTEPQ